LALVSRNIYHDNGNSNLSAVQSVCADLAKVCGSAQLRSFQFLSETYYNVEAEIIGTNPNEIVIVGAHIDSTAANERPYDAYKDDAPGADDDGSGVTGVLLVADALVTKQVKPKRTIRFVVFNAEEYWIRGSTAYAKALHKTKGIKVAGMIAMDMISWRRPGESTFEIHSTGSSDYPDAKPGSDALADIIEQAAIGEPLVPERYPFAGSVTDPANERSDHSSFQMYGWPACLVCENFWIDNVALGPMSRGNPNYHMKSDVDATLDEDYAAAIIRTVARATWTVANL
jgi:Zn-dependent M28 family amino/carboxypeptidase